MYTAGLGWVQNGYTGGDVDCRSGWVQNGYTGGDVY